MSSAATGFDVSRFRDWLAAATGEAAEVSVSPIRGGGSCEMFRVDRLGQSWVVRRAPLAAVSDTAHQVVREARIMEALGAAGVPVPTVLARSDDPTILGAPFFVMSYVDGGVIRRDGLPEALHADPSSHGADRRATDRHPGRTARDRLVGQPHSPNCPTRRGFSTAPGRSVADPTCALPGPRPRRCRRARRWLRDNLPAAAT